LKKFTIYFKQVDGDSNGILDEVKIKKYLGRIQVVTIEH